MIIKTFFFALQVLICIKMRIHLFVAFASGWSSVKLVLFCSWFVVIAPSLRIFTYTVYIYIYIRHTESTLSWLLLVKGGDGLFRSLSCASFEFSGKNTDVVQRDKMMRLYSRRKFWLSAP